MKLEIYSKEGQLKLTVAPESNNAESLGIQEESALALSFTGFACVPLEVYDYAEFLGRRYWVTERYVPKMNARKEWAYSVSLYGVEGLAAQTLMVNPDDGDNPVLTLTAPAREHAALIVANLNRRMETTEWKVGEVVVSEYIDIEYTGKYASDALSELSEAAGTEWWFDGMTLNISRCEFGEPVTLSYGDGLLGGISRTTADGVKFFTRLFPVGSSRNIDPDYYGHARLQLPDGAKYVEQDTRLGIVEHYEQEAFEDIFPRRVGQVGTVRHEEATGDDGEPFTIWYFTDPDIPFDPNQYEIGGLVKRVTFQSGELRGREFEVNYDAEKKEFEIITQWPYDDDLQLPSEPLIPASGDEYILWNIRMPESYYPAAEQEYKEAVDQFMADNRKDLSVWQAPTDFTVIERRGLDLRPGQRVRLESAEAFPDTGFRETRIVSISRSVVRPGSMTLKMSDVLSTGRISRIESSIASVERLTKQVSSEFPDLIRSWEETPASDTTVYTSRKSEREFLNKRRGGTVEGPTEFRQRVTFGEDLRTSNFISSLFAGKGAGIDQAGNAEFESVRVRSALEVLELLVNRLSAIEGDQVLTEADTIERVEDLGDGCYGLHLRSKWEGYFTAQVENNVLEGIINTLAAGSGEYRTSWMRVNSVNAPANYIEVVLYPDDETPAGKNYPPTELMRIARRGNQTDPTRQSCLYLSSTEGRIVRRFEQEFPPLDRIKEIYERICSYLQIGIGEGGENAYLFNLSDFCAREHLYPGSVQSTLKLLQQNGYMTLTDAQDNPARVMFCVSRDELYKLRVKRDDLDHFIRTLLRLYNGVFSDFRPIDEGELATWSGYSVERVKELLKQLWQLRVIRYIPSNRSPILFMNEERLPRADLYIAPETYRRRQELMRERFERMLAYAANEEECRSTVLERYFGSETPTPCGICDVCLARKRAARAAEHASDAAPQPAEAAPKKESDLDLRNTVLRRLAASPADPRELAAGCSCTPERLARVVRELLEEGKIVGDKGGILKIIA